VKRKRALQRCNLPRDNLVGAHSSRCGQRGGKQDLSRAVSSSSQQSRHRTNSPPHALKIFLCFVNQQSISIHDCSGGVRVWDTLPCLHTGVSYPGAFIPPGTSPPEAARESEKPAGKSFEKFKGKDREPLHLSLYRPFSWDSPPCIGGKQLV